LEAVIRVVTEFCEMAKAKKAYENKLERLNCKLKAERSPCCGNDCGDCGCEDEDECDDE